MLTRRQIIKSSLLAGGAAALTRANPNVAAAESESRNSGSSRRTVYTPVFTPDGVTLPFTMKDGVKEFRLTADAFDQEFAPGMKVKCWGYNGRTPGPTIEAVEGDRVRIYLKNNLPEHTTIHWHGFLLPNGMDGVGGLNQPHIKPGETYVYEFTLKQHGTLMYHPHADEMVQLAFGLMGVFVIHPKSPTVAEIPPVDRDFVVFPHMWAIHPGSYRPDPFVMLDFNIFTLNGRVFPATSALTARLGDRVRIRFGNLSMDEHPMHLHGYQFKVTGTDGGRIPVAAQWPAATVQVPVGTTRDIEFVADAPGDWVLHCHKSHHTMNPMAHSISSPIGVAQAGVEEKLRALLPGYMAMGERGMAEHQQHAEHMKGPENTLPMMTGTGPFGPIEMGGMFTMLKVRENLEGYDDPGWYKYPEGSISWKE